MDALVEPLALRLTWHFQRPVEPPACARALGALLAGLVRECSSPSGHVLGHIKAYAPLPGGGCLRGNAVSARQAPDVELRAPAGSRVTRLDLTLNVLVIGLEREECRRRSLAALDEVAARHSFEQETLTLLPQGEH